VLRQAGSVVGRILVSIAALAVIGISLLVVADVTGRTAFNSPVRGTPEIVAMSIVIISFLLAGYAVQSGSMLKADILPHALGRRGPPIAALLSGILGAGFFGLIAVGSWEPTLLAWTSGEFEGEGSLHVPVWPARLVVMIGALLVTLIYVRQTISAFLQLIGRGPLSSPSGESNAPEF
jgi:TRAP-type C4-dicarboxylate transport system permease small subunit